MFDCVGHSVQVFQLQETPGTNTTTSALHTRWQPALWEFSACFWFYGVISDKKGIYLNFNSAGETKEVLYPIGKKVKLTEVC